MTDEPLIFLKALAWILVSLGALYVVAYSIFKFVQIFAPTPVPQAESKLVSLVVIQSCGDCSSLVVEETPETYRDNSKYIRRLLCSHPTASVVGDHTKKGIALETHSEASEREDKFSTGKPTKIPPSECPLRKNLWVRNVGAK